MNANNQTKHSELLLGAATALSNQWSPNWTRKLETLGKSYQKWETDTPIGKTRDEFIKDNPNIIEDLRQAEEISGALQRFSQVNFKDGRYVAIFRFERHYLLEFQNTDKETQSFGLTREAFFCLASMHALQLTTDEYEAERTNFSNQ